MNTLCHVQSNVMNKGYPVAILTSPIPDMMWYKLNGNVLNYKVNNVPIQDATSFDVTYQTTPPIAYFVTSRIPGQLCYLSNGDASSNYILFPSISRPAVMSFSIWINVTRNVTFSRIFDFGAGFRLHLKGAQSVVFNDRVTTLLTTSFIGTWKHLAGVSNNLAYTLYENGLLKATGTLLTSTAGGTNPSTGFLVKSQGGDPMPVCRYSDFRVYGRVLTASEISSIYNSAT
jgi:Concanavalin A-like lectin/glucanases superfamily